MALLVPSVPKLSLRVAYALEAARLWLGGKPPAVQVAALPWRRATGGRIEILMATSRDTGRWVLPKGWPQKKRSLSETAACEAWEETGMLGRITTKAVGSFFYRKRLDSGLHRRVRVTVFPLAVSGQAETWPENGQRELRWFSPEEAARHVHEPELAELLRNADVMKRLA